MDRADKEDTFWAGRVPVVSLVGQNLLLLRLAQVNQAKKKRHDSDCLRGRRSWRTSRWPALPWLVAEPGIDLS
jgi:hypothetical protein